MDKENILEWADEVILENLNYILSQVYLRTQSSDDAGCLEYVLFSLDKLLPLIPLEEVEGTLLEIVCPVGTDIFLNMKKGIENLNDMDSLSQTQINSTEALSHLTTVCCDILQSLKHCCEHFIQQSCVVKYGYVKSLVVCVKIVVYETLKYNFAKTKFPETQSVVLSKFHQAACELLSSFLQLVTHKIEFSFESDSDIETVVTITGDVMENAFLTCDMGPVVMADTWKKTISLVEKYTDYLKINLSVCTVVKNLCRKLATDLDNFLLLSESSLRESVDRLKISNFLLKIVVKLCRIFSNSLLEIASDLMDLLLDLYRTSPSYLRAKGKSAAVIYQITSLLVIGADYLLSALYAQPLFPPILKEKVLLVLSDNPYGCIILLVSILKKLTLQMRQDYFSSEVNVLELIFCALQACHEGVVTDTFRAPGSALADEPVRGDIDLYEYVLTATGAFTLTLNSDSFSLAEDTLLRGVLQPDPWKAMLAMDLWCLVARYANANVCHSTLETLIQVFQNLDMNSSSPEFVYLSSLVNRLLPFCAPKFAESLVKRYPPRAYPSVWRVLCLNNAAFESQLPDIVDGYMSLVREWIKSSDESPSQFLKVESCLLSISSSGVSEDALDVLQTLWEIEPQCDMSNPWCDVYIGAVASASATAVPQMPNQLLLIILRRINHFLAMNATSSQKLYVLKMLKNLPNVVITSEKFEKEFIDCLAVAFRSILTSHSPVLESTAMSAFASFAISTHHPAIIELTVASDSRLQQRFVDFLQMKLPEESALLGSDSRKVWNSYHHQCPERVTSHTYEVGCVDFKLNPKRFKCDLDSDDSAKLQETLARFEKDSCYIVENISLLSEKQREIVRSVCDKFSLL